MFGLNLNPGSGGTFSRFSGAPVVRWSARVHYFSSNSPPRKKGIPIDQRGEQKDPGVAQQQKVAARPALRYALVVIVGGGGAIFYSTQYVASRFQLPRFYATTVWKKCRGPDEGDL